jgi:hypothetical protein
MRRPGTIIRHLPLLAVALGLAWLGLTRASAAGDDDQAFAYKVIVNPVNPVTVIDRDRLREAFLKKATDWASGEAIRPVDLARRSPVRERFTAEVLHKTPSQLRSYWNQQIFSGKGVPPPEAPTPGDVVAYVLGNPGAIGYIPAAADAGRAKVVRVK